jgi:flagellar basal-body rod protein FlgB
MDGSSAGIILKALEGLSARITVAAENIANAGTPNYRPLRVTFEEALKLAARNGPEAVTAVRPQIVREPASSEGLRLDLELASDTQTAARYSALVEILNRQLQIESLAITGNS